MAFNQTTPKGFSMKKTYMSNILREQAKSLVTNEEGETVAHSNPIEGVPPSAQLVKPTQPTNNARSDRRNIGLPGGQPAPFRMRKTFYTIADR